MQKNCDKRRPFSSAYSGAPRIANQQRIISANTKTRPITSGNPGSSMAEGFNMSANYKQRSGISN